MHSSVQAGAAAGKRADESNRGESRVVEKRTKKLEGKRVVKKQGEREREREREGERERRVVFRHPRSRLDDRFEMPNSQPLFHCGSTNIPTAPPRTCRSLEYRVSFRLFDVRPRHWNFKALQRNSPDWQRESRLEKNKNKFVGKNLFTHHVTSLRLSVSS